MPPSRALRVSLLDPSASTPPYDHLLASALARAGAEVELLTSKFVYGPVPEPDGYVAREAFYRRAANATPGSRQRFLLKGATHLADMARVRSRLRRSDVSHWQWVALPPLDQMLIGPRPGGRPRVFTVHYPLPEGGRALRRQRRLLSSFDAIVTHTEGAASRIRAELGIDAARVRTIPHGPLDYLTALPDERPLPPELAAVEGPVILFFGLLRDYKGVDTLLEAFAAVDGAELWVAGKPSMPMDPLRELAARAPGTVRFIEQFIPDPEIPALFRRADVLALPYRRIEQSGVLHAGFAFGKAMVLGNVGGFSEVGRRGVARLVEPDDVDGLARELSALIADAAERERLGAAALELAHGEFSWDAIAARTIDLYREIGAGA